MQQSFHMSSDCKLQQLTQSQDGKTSAMILEKQRPVPNKFNSVYFYSTNSQQSFTQKTSSTKGSPIQSHYFADLIDYVMPVCVCVLGGARQLTQRTQLQFSAVQSQHLINW